MTRQTVNEDGGGQSRQTQRDYVEDLARKQQLLDLRSIAWCDRRPNVAESMSDSHAYGHNVNDGKELE
jgi:hypothetical protein